MTTPAVPAAVQPAVPGAWLTQAQQDAAVGQVVTPVWPGPVSENHAGGPETVPGRDPEGGQQASPIPPDQADTVSGGGGHFAEYPDTGHGGPVAPFATQGAFFGGSGPIVDTHSGDTGGVERKEHVIQPQAKGWFRRVLSGMTYDSQAQVTDTMGWRQNVPAGRTDLDQYQGQDADAYDPFLVPYSERPVHANFAYEAVPLTGTPGAYIPSGQLPEMIPTGGQGNLVYVEPDDPEMTPPQATQTAGYVPGEDVGYF